MPDSHEQISNLKVIVELLKDADFSKRLGTLSAAGSLFAAFVLAAAAPAAFTLAAAVVGMLGAVGASTALTRKVHKEHLIHELQDLLDQASSDIKLNRSLLASLESADPDELTLEKIRKIRSMVEKHEIGLETDITKKDL